MVTIIDKEHLVPSVGFVDPFIGACMTVELVMITWTVDIEMSWKKQVILVASFPSVSVSFEHQQSFCFSFCYFIGCIFSHIIQVLYISWVVVSRAQIQILHHLLD